METYTFLRQLADSWMLLALFAFFIGVVLWAMRPGSSEIHEDTANIPFRHEDAPAPPRADKTSTPDKGGKPARNEEART